MPIHLRYIFKGSEKENIVIVNEDNNKWSENVASAFNSGWLRFLTDLGRIRILNLNEIKEIETWTTINRTPPKEEPPKEEPPKEEPPKDKPVSFGSEPIKTQKKKKVKKKTDK